MLCVLPVCWVCVAVLRMAADAVCVCLHTPDNPHWSDSEGLAAWTLAPPTPSRSLTQLLIHTHHHLYPPTHVRTHKTHTITVSNLWICLIYPDCFNLLLWLHLINLFLFLLLSTGYCRLAFPFLLCLWLSFLLTWINLPAHGRDLHFLGTCSHYKIVLSSSQDTY